MGIYAKLTVICLLQLFSLKVSASIDYIKTNFGSNLCIQGSLSTVTIKATETLVVKEAESDIYESKYFIENQYYPDALLKLHELAQFNEVDYYYKLIKDEGPSHNKLYTVGLLLGNEEFIGQGSSLKKAQQKCASFALERSGYEPPITKQKEINTDAITPTVLLNNLCAKLGISVEYFVVNQNFLSTTNSAVDEQIKKTYWQKLNESLHLDIHTQKDDSEIKGPFKVGVKIGELFFYGESKTIQFAKHDAASKAIDHLLKEVEEGKSVCLRKDSEEECQKAKTNLKSPISLVNEAAQIRNLQVKFEVINEFGPSHKRDFITKCTLGNTSTTGQGKSKKASKRMAAINMLERITELKGVSQEMRVNNIMKNKNQKKKNKKIIKTNFDMFNMHIEKFFTLFKDVKNPQDLKINKKPRTDKPKYMHKSLQDDILELSNALKFDVQFLDFSEGKQFYTIMSLHINPEHICLGEGNSSKSSRNRAARGGLILLQNMDFTNNLKKAELTILESEIKQKISILLNKETYEE